MKRKAWLAGAGCLLLASSVWASSPLPLVHWLATQRNGGFEYQNETGAPVKVTVVLQAGEVMLGTDKHDSNFLNTCNKVELKAGSMISAVCDLAPLDTLFGNIDYQHAVLGEGTYQVSLLN